MNKKTAAIVIAAVIAAALACIPLISIENRRAYYEKWGDLAVAAETNEKARYIIEHEDEYSEQIIKYYYSHKTEPDDLDFVYDYAFHKNDYQTMSYTEEELNSKTVPALYMGDFRWCYQYINGGYIKRQGCAAVSLTMAYVYLTGRGDIDPYKVMKIADDMGATGYFGGITDERIGDVCESLGLELKSTSYGENRQKTEHVDINTIKSVIDSGHVLMAGMFGDTFGTHALIIAGYDGDSFIINDPESPEKSSKMWTFDELEPEIVFIYDISLKN